MYTTSCFRSISGLASRARGSLSITHVHCIGQQVIHYTPRAPASGQPHWHVALHYSCTLLMYLSSATLAHCSVHGWLFALLTNTWLANMSRHCQLYYTMYSIVLLCITYITMYITMYHYYHVLLNVWILFIHPLCSRYLAVAGHVACGDLYCYVHVNTWFVLLPFAPPCEPSWEQSQR